MKKCTQSNMDGEVIDLEYVSGSSNIGNTVKEASSDFMEDDDDFYDIRGRGRKRRAKRKSKRQARRSSKREERQDIRSERREQRKENREGSILDPKERSARRREAKAARQERKSMRTEAKLEQAKSQSKLADVAGASVGADAMLAEAMAKGLEGSSTPSKGLSTTAKIGIAVAVAAAIGLTIYLIKRSKK